MYRENVHTHELKLSVTLELLQFVSCTAMKIVYPFIIIHSIDGVLEEGREGKQSDLERWLIILTLGCVWICVGLEWDGLWEGTAVLIAVPRSCRSSASEGLEILLLPDGRKPAELY